MAVDCIQFKINGKTFQFRGVSVSGNPSIGNILKAINRTNYKEQLLALNEQINPTEDFDQISIGDYTEAGNYLLGNLSLMDLHAVKAKYGHYKSDHLSKIISLLNSKNFNVYQSNIRVANSADKTPTIYLGNFRNLITINPDSTEAELSSALSYAFIDDQLREPISGLTQTFNTLRTEFSKLAEDDKKATSIQKDLDIIPDNINKNKRFLFFLSQGLFDNDITGFVSKAQNLIQEQLNNYLDQTEILNRLDNYNSSKELGKVFPIDPKATTTLNGKSVKVKNLLTFKDAFDAAFREEMETDRDYTDYTDQQIADKLGIKAYIEGAFPTNFMQRQFLYNLEDTSVAASIYDSEYATEYDDSYYNKDGVLSVNKVINKALTLTAERKGKRDKTIQTEFLFPKAKVLFEPDLLVRSKRKLRFYDDRKRMNRNALQLKISDKKSITDNFITISKDGSLPNIPDKARTLAIKSKSISNLTSKQKNDILNAIKDSSNILTVNLDGDDMELVAIADALGFNINVYSDNWKTGLGIHSRDNFIKQFDSIKLDKSTNVPLTPTFKFYTKNSRSGYYFGGNNVTSTILEKLGPGVEHFDLVRDGTIKSLLIDSRDTNKALLSQELNQVFDLKSYDSNDRIRMSITNKQSLSDIKREPDNDTLGTVFSDIATLDRYIQVGENFYNIKDGSIKATSDGLVKIYQAPYKDIEGQIVFRVEGGVFGLENGFSNEVSDLQNYYSDELTDISTNTGYSRKFLLTKFFDKVEKFDNNWIYDVDTDVNRSSETQFELNNFDANGLVTKIIKDLGIKVNVISKSKYGKDVKAYVENGEINLVAGSFTEDSLVHELTHILLANVKAHDYPTYQGLLNMVEDGNLELIEKKYPNMSQNDLREEALVTYFADTFTSKITDNPELQERIEQMEWTDRLREVLKLNRNPEQPLDKLMNSTIQVILNNYGSNYNELFKDVYSPAKAVVMHRLSSLKESLIREGKLKQIPC